MNELRHIVCFLLFCVMAISNINGLTAQHTSHSDSELFSFAYNSNGAEATSASIPAYKYDVARQVFDRLVEAKGVKNMVEPTFQMTNAEQRPAWTKPSEALVALEEKAYDLCMSMGSDSLNAIAALLSHELIHYYEKHDWRDRFSHQSDIEMEESASAALELELQADHLGGLLAHIAGYNTLGVLPGLLPELYAAYGLSPISEGGYLDLSQRQKVARESDILLTKNSRIFDMSVFLTAIGSYEFAGTYLEYLLLNTQFHSREIYNNLGVLSLLSAIEMMPAAELKFVFPVEIETSSRLSTRTSLSDEIERHLITAEKHFKSASILDESYGPSLLNMATVYALKGELLDAEYYAKKARAKYENEEPDTDLTSVYVLEGIIAALKGEKEKAQELFITSNSDLGRMNLCLMDERSDCYPTARRTGYADQIIIDGVNLNQLYSRIMRDQEQALISIDLNSTLSFHTIAKAESEILVSLDNQNIGSYDFFQIVPSSELKLRGALGVGTHISDLKNDLGSPDYHMNTAHGVIWVYGDRGLLFSANTDGRITEWAVYKSSQR